MKYQNRLATRLEQSDRHDKAKGVYCCIDDNEILPTSHRSVKTKPVKKCPYFIIIISLIQVTIHFLGGEDSWLTLALWCDPHRRHEIWRFLTVAFVHVSYSHLFGNIFVQLLLGILLEIIHHAKCVGIIYLTGVIGGTMSFTVFNPQDYALGASAAVCALIFSYISTLVVNWKDLDYKCYRMLSLSLVSTIFLVPSFFVFTGDLELEGSVSHSGHFGGAVTGTLVSIILLTKEFGWKKALVKICKGILLLLTAIVIIVNTCFPSRYLKSEFNFDYFRSYYEPDHITIETFEGEDDIDDFMN